MNESWDPVYYCNFLFFFLINVFQISENEWLVMTTRWRQTFLLHLVLPPGSLQRQTTAPCHSQTSRLLNDLHFGCAQIKSVSVTMRHAAERDCCRLEETARTQGPSDRGKASKQVRPSRILFLLSEHHTPRRGSEVTVTCVVGVREVTTGLWLLGSFATCSGNFCSLMFFEHAAAVTGLTVVKHSVSGYPVKQFKTHKYAHNAILNTLTWLT